jgi:DMSO/TMAO reductase YedYZ molybdopterin-dependent catalytic subunit
MIDETQPEAIRPEEIQPSDIDSLPAGEVPHVHTAEVPPARNAADEVVLADSRKRTRRSFAVGAVAAAAGYGALRWLDRAHQVDRLQEPLRKTIDFDGRVSRAIFNERSLAPTYRVDQAIPLRLNGNVGIAQNLVLNSWRLQLVGTRNDKHSPRYVPDVTAWEYKYTGAMQPTPQAEDVKSAPGNGKEGIDASKTGNRISAKIPTPTPPANSLAPDGAVDSDAGATLAAHIEAMVRSQNKKRNIGNDEAGPSTSSLDIGTPGLLLTMDDLTRQLPRVELVMQFKCIEGWSNITQWEGFRFRDLLDLYPPELIDGRDPRYVYLETPDGNYYGGYDLAMARHPQTLLVTGMHGVPLTQEHGAPMRLYTPLKYGYKQIKRVGLIAYTNQKPDDYWTKLGYDWYAGL